MTYSNGSDSNAWPINITYHVNDPSNIVFAENPFDYERSKKVRGLYRVIIVDPDEEKIVFDTNNVGIGKYIVAKGEESARLQAFMLAGEKITKDPEDYDVGVILLVKMRKAKEVQEVKLVE